MYVYKGEKEMKARKKNDQYRNFQFLAEYFSFKDE